MTSATRISVSDPSSGPWPDWPTALSRRLPYIDVVVVPSRLFVK